MGLLDSILGAASGKTDASGEANPLIGILGGLLAQSGGLQGNTSTDAFYVICDATNNTASTIQQGIVNIEVGVALQDPAEFVVISVGLWAGGSSTTVSGI